MISNRLPAVAIVSTALLLATQGPALAAPAQSPRTLVIGVDHIDAANQQPDKFRLFEYTDFFSREVRVRKGDTLDFRTAPAAFHIVAVSRTEAAARNAYPIALLDKDDPPAIGTGKPKIELGPSNGSITNGTTHGGGTVGGLNDFPPGPCGIVQLGQKACTFRGGDDVESQGGVAGFGQNGPMEVDWQITINANPGAYAYFCYIHPGMRGRVIVVGKGERDDDAANIASNANHANEGDDGNVTTQAQINAASEKQFREDQEDALEAEKAANVVRFNGGSPGERTYRVSVGVSAAENHVAIDEMLPQHLNFVRGDKVEFQWRDPHNVHTVGFPASEPPLPPPFDSDKEPNEPNEVVGDPGTSPSGTFLTTPSALVDAGLLVGRGYHLQPTVQQWSVRTNSSTALGTFEYHCTVHDFMHGFLTTKP
jgi:plastocyanin